LVPQPVKAGLGGAARGVAQVDAPEPGRDPARPASAAREPPRTVERRPSGAMEHPHQRSWCICFTWDGTDAHDVEIVDYH